MKHEEENMKKKGPAFERIMEEALREAGSRDMLQQCVEKLSVMNAKKIPVRIRLIAMGFLAHMDLEQLNAKLNQYGCARLYSRSIWEAGLIYAFKSGMSYEEYRRLEEKCSETLLQTTVEDRYFQDSRITVQDIRNYVADESCKEEGQLKTRHVTELMQKELEDAAVSGLSFEAYIENNKDEFRVVREKSRYYFCKYLSYYIDAAIDSIISYAGKERKERAAMDVLDLVSLDLFRGTQKIRKYRMEEQEILKTINESALSLGTLFDAFNEFYCGYVTMNWMDILMEMYEGHLTEIKGFEREIVLKAIRSSHPEWNHMGETELLIAQEKELAAREKELDNEYSENSAAGYQKGRAGENTIRKYIKGTLDIDRTTLVCFLLFFAAKGRVPKGQEIDAGRLSEMLVNAGYSGLDADNDFDYFILQYFDSDEKLYYLMEEVTGYAMQAENSSFYQLYRSSRSQESDIRDYFSF